MIKDTPEGTTHHHKDACYKCKICGDHFFIESQAERCNHDLSIAQNLVPPNAQRTGDTGKVAFAKGHANGEDICNGDIQDCICHCHNLKGEGVKNCEKPEWHIRSKCNHCSVEPHNAATNLEAIRSKLEDCEQCYIYHLKQHLA